ncbi:MAG: Txe/YoeB family addiction module toxin, partial [Guyparkeria sp.]
MNLVFSGNAWEDYLYWQKTDKKTLRRINKLIDATKRQPFEGVGKPESLKHSLAGYWS